MQVQDLIRWATGYRYSFIRRYWTNPRAVQQEQLALLIAKGRHTSFGRERSFGSIGSYVEFRRRVDLGDYNTHRTYIERARSGGVDVLWPGRVRWFAKSSGTTEARSKYIPVTEDGLRCNHLRGMKDVAIVASRIYPTSKLFDGYTLTLGGSCVSEEDVGMACVGDLSAILISQTPRLASSFRRPSQRVALMPNFEEKIEALCRECATMNITSIAGVPSWNLVMLRRILEYSGKRNILEVWPGLELFVHGGVNFRPYRKVYERLIPSSKMHYMETYNASEGFFAMADRADADDMLLMLDYGTFYEFLPTSKLDSPESVVPLSEVKCGVEYAVIVSNCNGLWRYMIGDAVEFTSIRPYRIRITGRIRSYINAFGEELIVDNADRAIEYACQMTGAEVEEYTAAPLYMDADRAQGAHQWLVEFRLEPLDMAAFVGALDIELRRRNSDYDAKREGDITLRMPIVTTLPTGSFMRWLASEGKLGGQHKVPRLRNDRMVVDKILEMIETKYNQHTTH